MNSQSEELPFYDQQMVQEEVSDECVQTPPPGKDSSTDSHSGNTRMFLPNSQTRTGYYRHRNDTDITVK